MEFGDFILVHDGDDLGRLALSRDRLAGEVDDFDLALTTLEVRRKLRTKVPEWYAVPSLRYPLRVSGEQCSSSATARYKASVALASVEALDSIWAKRRDSAQTHSDSELNPGKKPLFRPVSLADLTGGLGVDSWAFAQVFDQVLYNEMQSELADAARHNFALLGAGNITVRNFALAPSTVMPAGTSVIPAVTSVIPSEASVSHIDTILGAFHPDIMFLDPARRAADGRKVFRLEDCRPDVLQLLPELLATCPLLLLKLSPMADITLVCRQLGCVREVHVVAAEGECKELLLLLERDWIGPYALTVFEDGTVAKIDVGPCHPEERTDEGPVGESSPGSFLFEPGKALLKAGAFDWPCRFGLAKLGRHTHYYIASEPVEPAAPFGKWFRILEAVPLNNKSIKDIGRRYPVADVTARNIPLTSDQLRAKLGVRSGGPVHIFGLHIDAENANFLLICQ